MAHGKIRVVRAVALLMVWAAAGRVAVSQTPAPSANPDTTPAAVVDAAVAYVTDYEQKLTSVLATEVSTQKLLRQLPIDPAAPKARALKSEMFFMFSPAEHEWMAVRDVSEVDGKRVENPPDLKAALSTLPFVQVVPTLKKYSSRFNLGRTVRNFGEPTLGLLVLDANHRANFSFYRRRVDRKPEAVLVTLAFVEAEPARLIHDLYGTPVLAEGELVVEAGTGRIRQTLLRAQIGTVHVELTTTYVPDARLGLLVPSVFREQYEDNVPAGVTPATAVAHRESIECEAKYTNFRRFEVNVKIR